jgi:hypothetical protein
MSSADSDDEYDPFMMFKKNDVLVVEEEEEVSIPVIKPAAVEEIQIQKPTTNCGVIDDLFLRKDIYGLEALMSVSDKQTPGTDLRLTSSSDRVIHPYYFICNVLILHLMRCCDSPSDNVVIVPKKTVQQQPFYALESVFALENTE